MATVIDSVGYGGTVTEANTAQWARALGGADYGISGPGDWLISSDDSAVRGVKMAIGTGWGRSVIDTVSGDLPTKQLDIVASGSRYDLLVWRRNWAGLGGTSSLEVVKGNATPTGCLGLRNTDWPTLDDQPLAIAKVTAGSTVAQIVNDLRLWPSNGGLVAKDLLVRDYLTSLGTSIRIGSQRWDRVPDGFGGSGWKATNLEKFAAAAAAGNCILPKTTQAVLTDGTLSMVISNIPAGKYQLLAKGFVANNTAITNIKTTLKLSVSAGLVDTIEMTPAPGGLVPWSLQGLYESATPFAVNIVGLWTGTSDAGAILSAWNQLQVVEV